jgi:hypothetical protein
MIDDSPRYRFDRDPKFRMLVMALYKMIEECKFSGSEIREAAMLALILYEERHVRSHFIPGDLK